jgi:hypothetical protein
VTIAICREIINQLKKAQELRQLIWPELGLIKQLKVRILGIAAVQRSRARQRPRLTWLRKGDANTKFFDIMANQRKKRNHIHSLHSMHEWL